MIFEWDPEKARENEQKHGISFAEASQVFDDDHSSTVQDPDHSVDEARYLIFGASKQGKHLVVSYTERGDRIRLISARQMTARERRAYEE
ncbi:MAG: BrnT family toxin [Betaproteobacteria bacterium]|nr:BrnT family toxin [Betaproteobacteria bacterium]